MKIKIDEEKSLVVVKKKIKEIDKIKITNQEKLIEAIEMRRRILETKRMIENQKKEIIEPLNQALERTKKLFRPYEEKLQEIDDWLKEQILQWELLQEEIRKKKEKEIEKKIAEGKISFEEASKKIEKIEQKIEKIPMREIPQVIITDKSKLPLDYLEPNLVLIRKELLAGKEIPGAELVKTKVVYNKNK